MQQLEDKQVLSITSFPTNPEVSYYVILNEEIVELWKCNQTEDQCEFIDTFETEPMATNFIYEQYNN